MKVLKIIGKIFKWLFGFALISGVVVLFGAGVYILPKIQDAPEITENTLINVTAGTTNMYDSQGNIIYSDTENRRDYINIEDVPQKYIDLLLSTENREYYQENGFSPKGLYNAGLSLFKEKVLKKGTARGGSTIEQQLIKNLVFSSSEADRTIDRKIKEIYLSIQMDKNFSKDQILEWYINLIFLGEFSNGANTISITYYGIPLSELKGEDPETISKLAIIAGLGQSPSAYNLYDNPEAVKKRRAEVLDSTVAAGKITEELAEQAKNVDVTSGLKERFWRNTEILAVINKHSAYITSALEQVKELGYDIKRTPLQIYTGLNQETNEFVKNYYDNSYYYEDDRQQIATTIIDNNTGYVLAEYGGRYSEAFGINRATQRTRSSGSAIKPFLSYGPAIEYFGFGSGYRLDSSPYVYPGTNFVANNYGGAVYGIVDMAFALKMSLNTPANRLLDEVVGSQNAKNFLQGLNMDVKDYYGGADALGLDVSTRDLAGAFAALSNKGVYKKPQYITKIKFNDGSEKEIKFEEVKAMKESTAYVLLKMLENVPKRDGTAIAAIIPEFQGYAVKTGTVGYAGDDGIWRPDAASSDGWIAGTTKNISMAVWMGYDSPNEPENYLSYSNKSNQQLFRDMMVHFNSGKDTSDWAKPSTVTQNGNIFTPNDAVTESSKFITPIATEFTVDGSSSSVIDKKKIKITDKGTPSYAIPENSDEILNWEASITDKESIALWKTYPNNSRAAIASSENAFFE